MPIINITVRNKIATSNCEQIIVCGNEDYTAIFDFGYSTDTLDIEGVKEKECGVIPTIEQIKSAMNKLIGEIDQIPPLYSAKVVNGRRAYDLAREGIQFELKPKKITIAKKAETSIGRNDLCPCGSGKKYKKCCGAPTNTNN